MSRRGFTLIEVLAVVALTSLVLGIALNSYVDLSRASNRASENTRAVRRAMALSDRLARDFEAAVLVTTPPEVDPLSHPWLFFAESRIASDGSDQIKFVTRNHRPRGSDVHESDLSMVAYSVRHGDDGESLELFRWSSPHLPESLDRDIPSDENDGAQLMADDLAVFSLRFQDFRGEWTDRWDSTTVAHANELPLAVEIEVGIWNGENLDSEDAETFSRRVLLPTRPIDLAVLLDPERALARSRAAKREAEAENGAENGDGNKNGNENGNRSGNRDGNRSGNRDGDRDEKQEKRSTLNDCSDPSSPIHNKTVERCINRAIVGTRVDELKDRYDQYLGDPFCRWQAVIPVIIVHASCL